MFVLLLSMSYSFIASEENTGASGWNKHSTTLRRQMKRRKKNTFCAFLPIQGSITKEKLSAYTHCEYISIENQSVSSIENGSFTSAVNLDRMTITGNDLKTIHGGMWNGLDKLTYLSLFKNYIENIRPHTFVYLPEMTELDLSLNQISEIRADIWDENSKLFKLNLRGNKIRTLSPGVFKNLKKLSELDVSENELRDIMSGTFEGLGLFYLKLDSNRLTELRGDMWDGMAYFGTFQMLTITNNLIERIEPGCFSRLNELGYLLLSNNPLGEISAEMFDQTDLGTLDLSFTGLTKFEPGTFMGSLSNLGTLTLNGNDLEMTSDMFQGLGKLMFLNLESAKISEIRPEFWNGLDSLHDLKLSKNSVNILRGGAFQNLHQLGSLYMESNQIEEVESGAFLGLQKIYALNFKDNKLSTVNQDIFDPTDFPDTDGHPRYLTLYLEGNPIQCDPALDWMIEQDWLDRYPMKQAKCADLPDMTLDVYLQCYTCQ